MCNDGGYFVPQQFRDEIVRATSAWELFNFMRANFPTLASYTPDVTAYMLARMG